MASVAFFVFGCSSADSTEWKVKGFERADKVNPILEPNPGSVFCCPIQQHKVRWESDHAFNPGAVVRGGKVYLIYRAEDNFGEGIGHHTSRLGLAVSEDGLHFIRRPTPVLYPDHDRQKFSEWPGGCEDPRIVETEDGGYVMTYTQWNRDIAVLGIATSDDLITWKKHGYAFEPCERVHSKSGSIVCRRQGDHLIATKIQGKYWMYWGEGNIQVAKSDDLISWEVLPDPILCPRPGKFDSDLVEPGPPAVLTKDGIIFLYNGKNSKKNGDPNINPGAYAAGQLVLDPKDPTRVVSRSNQHIFKPERPYERSGQYKDGTVFIQGLVHFKGKWLLYYGCADSAIGVAVSR